MKTLLFKPEWRLITKYISETKNNISSYSIIKKRSIPLEKSVLVILKYLLPNIDRTKSIWYNDKEDTNSRVTF